MNKILLLIFTLSLFFVSCKKNSENPTSPDNIDPSTLGKISFSMSIAEAQTLYGLKVDSVTIKLQGPTTLNGKLTIGTDTLSASGTFSNLTPGNYAIGIAVFSGVDTIATGTGNATVNPGQTTTANIALTLANGKLLVNVTWPNTSVKLIYAKNVNSSSKLFISNLDGKGEVQLTTGTSSEYQPKFNMDKTKIVFTSNRDGQYDVYTMHTDGSNVKRITTTGTHGGHNSFGSAAWTFDGKIVYTLNDKLYKINDDGSEAVSIYAAPQGRGIHSVLTGQYYNKIVVQIQGSWGYDLEHIVMNLDGSDSKQVVPNDPGGVSLGGFSPDGNKVLYSYDISGHEESSGKGLNHHIYILDLLTNVKTDISINKPSGNDLHPIFTPDGQNVLFVFNNPDTGSTSLWKMSNDGSNRVQLIDGVEWLVDVK